MKKVMLIGMLALAAFATSASAQNVLVNGDFSAGENAWTRWQAPWTNANNYAITNGGPTPSEGSLWLNNQQWSSFGWYQVVPVPASEFARVGGMWKGDVEPLGWAEVMLFSVTPGTAAGDIVTRIDTGAAADIAYKKDGWGLNGPAVWDWADASLAPLPGGNGGVLHSQGWVVVALKLGTGDWNPNHGGLSAAFDNLTLTPEPAAALLLLAGLPLLRRRRA